MRNHSPFLGLSLTVLCCLVSLSLPLKAAEGGILANGDFENGDTSGWKGYGCRLEVVTDDVHNGRYASKAWLDQAWGGGHFAEFTAPRGRYLVRMWIKTNAGMTGHCWVGSNRFSAGPKTNKAVSQAGKWTEVTFELRIAQDKGDIYVWSERVEGGWILLDDVAVTPMP